MTEYQISARLSLKDQMTAQLKAAYSAAEKLTRGIGDAKKSEIRLNVQGMEKLKRLQDMLRQGGMTIPKPINLRVNDNGATSKISKIRSDVTSLAGRAWNVAVNIKTNGMAALNRAKSNISEMANGAAMGAGVGMLGVAGIGFGAVDMIDTYKTFEYQMKRNKALFTTGLDAATAEQQYQDLEAAARHYGSIMKFTASEVGKAEEYMALAGWDAPTAIAALPSILNAAVASGEDLALVSDIITDDMTAMGYKAGDKIKNALGEDVEAAQHFADVMLRTTLRSNTNFQQLGLAMKYAAPLAHTLGYKIEEVAVAMGLMANNGIKADQAGTGLRGILNRFINEPKKAATAMENLGVSLFDAQGNAKGLMTTLMDVRAALKGQNVDAMIDFAEQMTGEQVENRRELTDFLKEATARGGGKLSQQDQAKLGSMLSGTYAMAAFMAIMNSSDEDIQKLMTEIYQKSDGTGADIARQMADTLQGDLDTIKSAWEDFNVELLSGKGANGLRSLVQTLTADINQFKNSLKDGLDFSDIGKLGIVVLDQLKDKFLQLDGIGSLLAGGALFMSMKKILSMGLQIKDTLSAWSKVKNANDLGNILRNSHSVTGTSQVGTMHVNAGVVNINGRVSGGRNSATTVAMGGSNGRPVAGGRNSTTTVATGGSGGRAISGHTSGAMAMGSARANSGSTVSRFAGTGSAAAGAGILTTLFSVMDVLSTRTINEGRVSEVQATYDENKKIYDETKVAYDEIVNDANRKDELPQAAIDLQNATQNLNQSSKDLKAIQRETAKNNNESFFGGAGAVAGATAGAAIGSIIPGAGTAAGAVAGMVLGTLGAIGGSIIGKEIGDNFDFDVLGWIKGDNDRTITAEKPVPVADWVTDSGKKYSELSTAQRIEYQQHESDTERVRRESAESEVTKYVVDQKHDENMQRWRNGEFGDTALDRVTKEEINAGIAEYNREKERKYTDFTHAATFQPQPVVTSMYDTEQAKEAMSVTTNKIGDSISEKFGSKLDYSSFFNPNVSQSNVTATQYDSEFAKTTINDSVSERINALAENRTNFNQPFSNQSPFVTTPYNSESAKNVIETKNIETLQGIKEQFGSFNKDYSNFVKPFSEQTSVVASQYDTESVRSANESARKTETTDNNVGILASIGNFFDSLLFNKAAANSITPETNMELSTSENSPVKPVQPSGGLFDFEMPDIGAKISETFSNFEMPDIGARIGEIFSGIELPELGIAEKLSTEFDSAVLGLESFGASISASFSGLAGSVSVALSGVGSAITTVFSSAATEVQSIWTAMPGFFSGVFSGLGGAASAAGSAIYGGLTSVIGGIIGAWQSAASAISGIISSISAMASSAASAAGNFFGGGIGSNAIGTSSWEGGFTEINEHGGEIINLPKGTQIIPHATTVKILRNEIRDKIERGENSFHGLNFADYGMNTILDGDIKTTTANKKTSRRIGQRQNSVSNSPIESIFTNIFGWTPRQASFSELPDLSGLFGSDDKGALSGDIITTLPSLQNKNKIGQRQNSVSNSPIESIFTNIFGWTPRQASFSGLPDLGGLFGSDDKGALSGDIITTLPNFDDKFDIELPKIEIPKVESGSSSSSSSSSNTFNFGGVNITNGADFDEFVYRLQNLVMHSSANSEMV